MDRTMAKKVNFIIQGLLLFFLSHNLPKQIHLLEHYNP